jgi:magnesium-transporting ATPase (P-type)
MKQTFSWRIFISFGLCLSFVILLVSGVLLYIFPGSRGNSGFVWEMFGLTKPAWQNQHIIFGFAFSILGLFHLLVINWKAFFSYLKAKTTAGLNQPGELLLIALLCLFIGFGTYFKLQPFSGILELGKSIAKSFDGNNAQAPKGMQGAGRRE